MWTETLIKAIDYIEENLTNEISNGVIEKIAGASFYNFQRVFVFVFNMTVSEYIRYRRLSLAAMELLESGSKIVDIAFKYGYESHESFLRAFTQFHNVLPSNVKENDFMLNYCSKAEIETNVKANIKMSKLKEISTQHILSKIKIKRAHEINLSDLMPNDNSGIASIKSGELAVSCQNDKFNLLTVDEYQPPLKIDITAKTDSTNLKLIYGQGDLTLNWQYSDWNYKINELMIHDIITTDCFGYPGKGKIECGEFNNISWIISNEFMALIINSELRYYNEYLPYITHLLKNTNQISRSKVGIAPAWGSTITIKRLSISEI